MSKGYYGSAYRDTQLDDAREVTYCADCHAPICEGYVFLRIGGEDFCESCVRQHWMIAEVLDDAPGWYGEDGED